MLDGSSVRAFAPGPHRVLGCVAACVAACASVPLGATGDVPGGAPAADSGFRWASADGANEVELEGLFQVVGVLADEAREPSSDVRLERMRPELAGRLAGALRFRLEPKFDEQGVELEEAWIGPPLLGGDAQLMIGRMKAPFGLEEVRSRRHIDFPRFSLLNQLSPAEDHGVFVNGRAASGRVEYGLAAYNGTGGPDTNGGKDLAARIMLHPFHAVGSQADEGGPWRHLQVGAAATVGEQDEGVGEEGIRNEAGLEVLRYADDARLDGRRERLGLELACFDGPWFVQAEGLWHEQAMRGASGAVRAGARGAYVTLAHVLTGETKTFAGVVPQSPHDFASGRGRGAWVVALRYSELRFDDDDANRRLWEAGGFSDRVRSLSLGLAWVPNRNAILRTAWVQSEYDDPIAVGAGALQREGALLLALQLHF